MKLRRLETCDHFSKTLKKRVDDWNEKNDALNTTEDGLPGRRAALCQKILDGTITGVEAVAERRKIETDAMALDVDRSVLFHAKAAFRDAFKEAHTAEADRLAKAAVARRDELTPAILKFNLSEAARNQILSSDAGFRAADLACRDLRGKAQAQTLDDADRQWWIDFEQRTISASGQPRSIFKNQ